MYLSRILFFFSIFFVCIPFQGFSQSPVNDHEVRTLITLLDYIGKDYAGAVEDGKIIEPAEFEEISEFTLTCINYHENLIPQVNNPVFTDLKEDLQSLYDNIQNKSEQPVIVELSRSIKDQVLALNLIKLTPVNWPVLKSGMLIYNEKCQSCHGPEGKGDGILAAGLEPAPTNFVDEETVDNLSPMQAYNVAKLGLQGTAMRAFEELTEAELWDVSFYIMSLSHQQNDAKIKSLPSGINLDFISQATDEQLREKLTEVGSTVEVAQLRTYEPERVAPLDIARKNLDASLEAFKENNKNMAQQLALSSYLEGVELVENTLKATDRSIVIDIEKAMLAYRNALKGDDLATVTSAYEAASDLITKAQETLDANTYSFGFTFGAALSILLREALEALLIIVVILSILRPLKIKKAVTFLHIGWIAALILGFASWLFVDQVMKISGSSREVMEGAGSLIAVVVLIYMGTWLHSKSEIKKWKEFIEVKVKKISESGNWWGLMLFSFIVVFREAFEVVLFFSALKLDIPEDTTESPLLWALIVSTVIIVILAVAIIKYSKRLPIKQIFKISAITMIVLSVVLVGKGFAALQEAGYIGMNLVSDWIRVESLGIFPTVQTLAAQVITIAFTGFLWWYTENKQASPVKE